MKQFNSDFVLSNETSKSFLEKYNYPVETHNYFSQLSFLNTELKELFPNQKRIFIILFDTTKVFKSYCMSDMILVNFKQIKAFPSNSENYYVIKTTIFHFSSELSSFYSFKKGFKYHGNS